mmetsp:Transcript_14527/g.18974  ORF Transcript_14527/g.18974 Transcript_14527/m.18974 type:complete len:215 (+) Transcript_14527:186-830(+)
MIFSVSLILLAALASPTLAKVDIHRNFLSEEEVEKFRQEFTESNLCMLGEERVHYKTKAIGTGLQSKLFALLLGNKNNSDTQRSDGESSCKVTQTMPELHLSQIVKSTTPHQDSYHENQLSSEGKTGFIFLEDNVDATFIQGEDVIGAESGKLVVFDGQVSHHTVLPNEQSVKLLGPFAILQNRLSLVGFVEEEKPTKAPKTTKAAKTVPPTPS